MAKLEWDQNSERLYETGVKNCVLYVMRDEKDAETNDWYHDGVAWNGVTAITETPSGAEATDLYADDKKYLSLYSNEELGLSLTAYTYPDQWADCDGSKAFGSSGNLVGIIGGQQARKAFGLAYITTVGNDVSGNDYGQKLHLVYGCKASPSERAYNTINDSPEAIEFSWEITTTKESVTKISGMKDTSIVTIDSNETTPAAWKALTDYVFGVNADSTVTPAIADKAPKLPTPDKIYDIVTALT